jgi:hypothetical protein
MGQVVNRDGLVEDIIGAEAHGDDRHLCGQERADENEGGDNGPRS